MADDSNLQDIVREAVGLDRNDIADLLQEQANHLKAETLANLARIAEGIRAGYADDGLMAATLAQVVRIRLLNEIAKQIKDGQH